MDVGMGPADILGDIERATTEGWTFTVEREQSSDNTRLRFEVAMVHPDCDPSLLTSRATSLKGAFAKVLMKWSDQP
ncbi:hypothetical protein SEA_REDWATTLEHOG_82 [Gordonia phage RedWattleHog]|uniref:Uncharacterized protein n=1 Tax=Gordonia phage Stormageddon TaxID=2656541 RepID=A0A649VSM7_9CAUD|nr:hypothetical protein KHQ86_gp079 [Gordonia phage Stormageddon]QGJ94942.1 hypothetical protein SEA_STORMAGEDDON_79 [Gordonia phage Stormageddon]QLF83586.1 hypothetical protein SEA_REDWATTLEHOG_82 [Gordonia phage RedWattleHog]